MACISDNEIFALILPPNGSVVEQVEAIEMLKAYAFNTERQTHTYGRLERIQNRVKKEKHS